ncbi:MAG: T9SS type A sorting domain-containing protein [Phycisphaerae bacterium]|nr:T9SS type A sorting domain-containing protein [Saprospiraceae bacterium]
MKNASLILSFLVTLYTTELRSQAGTLDIGFSFDGKLTTPVNTQADIAYAIAMQSDGKIVVAGGCVINQQFDFALVRYNPNGTLDNSFSSDGKEILPFGLGNDVVYGLAIQPDGKIVAAGVSGPSNLTSSAFALARFNPDGSRDIGFNGDGELTTSFGSSFETARAVVIQPDGKIVAAGSFHNGVNMDFGLARYLPDGMPDSSFSVDGKVITPIGENLDDAYAIVLQPDGKIVAAGRSFISPKLHFALARYNSDGSLDTSFGTGGKLTTNIDSSGGWATSLAIQPDGKLVAFGYVESGQDDEFAIARYLSDGTLDDSFGNDGAFLVPNTAEGHAVLLQPDGKIVVAGSKYNGLPGTIFDFALVRFNSNGAFDNSFGINGIVSTSFDDEDVAHAMVMQPDGKIVVAGYSESSLNKDFAVARYLSGLVLGVLDFSAPQSSAFIYPNPVGQQATLEYTLKDIEEISILLLDQQGKTIKSFLEQEIQYAGDHQQTLVFPGGLASGSYVLVLSNANGRIVIKLVR